MYQDTRRERLRRMQQIASRPQPNLPNNGTPRSPSTLMVGLLVFAMAGLLMGFVVGALNQPKQVVQNNNGGSVGGKPTATPTTAVTATSDITKTALGIPAPISYLSTEKVDGQTSYNISLQVTDKANGAFQPGNPLNIPGVTCKLWLIPPIPDHSYYAISKDALKDATAIQNPITGQFKDKNDNRVVVDNVQEVSGFNFDATTKQVQPSNGQGQATWKYTLSPSLHPGNYFILAFVWDGTYYNFAWRQITVQKGP